MSFLETPRFPEDISYGCTGGPEYQTDVVIVNSGHESRNMNWEDARSRYEVGHRGRTKAKTDKLIAFFRSVKGRAIGFRFKDWTDYQVTTENGILVAVDGGYQLAKKYDAGDREEIRLISKPVPGKVVIAGGGTVDYTTGMVTGANPDANWAGEFDVPCRFDTDRMEIEIMDKGIYSWGQIPVIEIRV